MLLCPSSSAILGPPLRDPALPGCDLLSLPESEGLLAHCPILMMTAEGRAAENFLMGLILLVTDSIFHARKHVF